MQSLSSYHNKKNGRGCCNPSEIKGFKTFSFFGFIFITIHNKKNGHSACNPGKIKAFKIFLNQDLHLLYI